MGLIHVPTPRNNSQYRKVYYKRKGLFSKRFLRFQTRIVSGEIIFIDNICIDLIMVDIRRRKLFIHLVWTNAHERSMVHKMLDFYFQNKLSFEGLWIAANLMIRRSHDPLQKNLVFRIQRIYKDKKPVLTERRTKSKRRRRI